MGFTSADLARMRLVSHGLVEPLGSVADAVRHHGCTQGQDYPGSSLSLALRSRERSLAGVRAAYDGGEIVRSWPMRGTLFVVAAEDLGWMLSLTAAGVRRSTTRRREQLGLTDPQLEHAESVAREALSRGGLTRADLLAAWAEAGHDVSGGRGYHTIFALAVAGVLCQGPTEGKEQRFVLNEQWIQAPRELDRPEAVIQWLRRYVVSHGPVPLADFAWWTKLTRRELAPAADALRPELATLELHGVEYWLAPDLPDRYAALRRATAAPLLLPGFDELVLGYGERSLILDPAHAEAIVPGGNGMFKPTVVHGGRIVGTWKRPTRKNAPVSATPLTGNLPSAVERALPRLTQSLPG